LIFLKTQPLIDMKTTINSLEHLLKLGVIYRLTAGKPLARHKAFCLPVKLPALPFFIAYCKC
jgi:hypothetical protein